MKMLIIRTKKK